MFVYRGIDEGFRKDRCGRSLARGGIGVRVAGRGDTGPCHQLAVHVMVPNAIRIRCRCTDDYYNLYLSQIINQLSESLFILIVTRDSLVTFDHTLEDLECRLALA